MAKSDGAVVIETRLSTEKMETDYKKIDSQTKKMINRYNKSVDSIKSQEIALENVKNKLNDILSGNKKTSQIVSMEKEIKSLIKEIEPLEKEYDRLLAKYEEHENEIVRYTTIRDTSGPDTQEWSHANGKVNEARAKLSNLKPNLAEIVEKYDAAKKTILELNDEIAKLKENLSSSTEAQNLTQKIENMTSKLEEAKKQTNELGQEINKNLGIKAKLSGITDGFDGIGKKVDKLKTRMTRLIGTVAIFSLIRSSLTKLRTGFISLLKENDTFSSSLNQIKANLMTAFAPIYNACLPAINSLMNSLSKLTGTIAVFVSGLFGTSLEDAKKQAQELSNSLNDTAKSGEKASGSLASFDNLEVVADTSGSSSGSSDSGIDYSGELTYSQKLLDILNKVKTVVLENKELFIGLGIAIAGAFVISKIVGFVSLFSPLIKVLKTISGLFIKVGEDGTKSFNNVGTGVTFAIAGFIVMVKSISDLITNWDDLDTKQKLIKIGLAALGVAAIALGYAIAAGISTATLGIGALIALIAALLTAIVSLTVKFFTEKDAILSVEEAQNKLIEAQNKYAEATDSYVSAVDKMEESMNKLQEAENRTGLSGQELYDQVQDGTLDYMNMNSAQKEVYKAYLENMSAQKELQTSTEELNNAKKEETMASFANQLAIAAETDNYDDYKKSVVQAYEEGKISADEARDLIEQSMSRMSDASQQTFMEDLPSDIKTGMDPDKYKTAKQKFKEWFSNTCSSIGDFFSKLFTETIPNKLNELKEKLKTFFTKTLPNLAISGVEMLVNKVISAFEKLINLPIKGINNLIDKANKIPGVDIGHLPTVTMGRVSIPRLATGAVIPPRSEFMAILGDQKRGVNIETPLDTMVEAFNKALDNRGNGNGELVIENLTIINRMGNTDVSKTVVKGVRIAEKQLGKPLFVN